VKQALAFLAIVTLLSAACTTPEVDQVGTEVEPDAPTEIDEAAASGDDQETDGETDSEYPGLEFDGELITTPSGLQYVILEEGTGEPAERRSEVTLHYVGYLEDGSVFDSTFERSVPAIFTIGSSDVIPAWHEGVTGMKVGERRKLIIPPHLAYGSAGIEDVIPPDETLVNDIQVLAIK
jgi:peptidylprolyl isomerase